MKESDILDALYLICKEAGKKILNFYEKKTLKVFTKDDNTPVTEADIAAHELIVQELKKISSLPIISEENSNNPPRLPSGSYWLIDPLDGTKNFIAKNTDFSINIALIKDKAPQLGCIYLPVFKEYYCGDKKNGAFLWDEFGNKKSIFVSPNKQPTKIKMLVSRHSKLPTAIKKAIETRVEFIELGASRKFCHIACGKADIYIRVAPTSVWDTAAGQCIVEAAGGLVTDATTGEALTYQDTYR